MSKTAIIAGSTGLVGGELLQLLLSGGAYSKVIAITRKQLELQDEKLQNLVIDFDNLEEIKESLRGDDVFCCLGTTMKKAGSKEKFKKVDYDYPLKLAEVTHTQGAHSFQLISALGSSKSSSVFYNKVKGEIEEAIEKVGFSAYHIFRPSLLLGERNEDRVGEDAAKTIFRLFGFLFVGPLKKYKAIKYDKVACAMYAIAQTDDEGIHEHESLELQKY